MKTKLVKKETLVKNVVHYETGMYEIIISKKSDDIMIELQDIDDATPRGIIIYRPSYDITALMPVTGCITADNVTITKNTVTVVYNYIIGDNIETDILVIEFTQGFLSINTRTQTTHIR